MSDGDQPRKRIRDGSSLREAELTRNSLERFIGIWSDLTEEDRKLFEEILEERKRHARHPSDFTSK